MIEISSLKDTLKSYNENRRIKNHLATIYYKKLVKASLLISTVSIIVVAIMVIYSRLTFLEGVASAIAVFIGSLFFAKPYLDDLSSLTNYVEQLALNKKAETPTLSLLGNVDELSDSVKNLHNSWENRNVELEAALAESSILFDTIPDILLMLDKKLTIVRANNAAINNLQNDIVGKNINDIIPNKGFIDTIQNVLKTGKQASLEAISDINNTRQDYLVMAEKFPVKSITGVSIVLIMHNITESKRVKQMLKDFVSNASHEIRTPLTSVSGFIENLQSIGDDSSAKKTTKKFLSIMAEQTGRMSQLVDDLLSLSKVEINEDNEPTDVVSVEELLSSIVRRLKWIAGKQNIKLAINKKGSIPDIIGDKNELTQVFTNIISNAIKYGKPKSTVQINTSVTKKFQRSRIMPKNCSELLLVSIKDEGEGIAEEHLPRITERFYRVDKVRSRKIGGTGLGLAITKHILNRHKGDLLIESKIEKGSTFTVRLPITKIPKKKKI